jgi:hypothetical protein
MKYLAAAIAVLMLVPAVQARQVGSPIFGAKAGMLGTTVYGDDSSLMKTRFGAVFGVTAEYPLTPMVSVQGELVYSMRGWKNDSDFGSAEINQKIGYLEIPVLLRLNSTGGGPGPYLVLGPALAVKTNDSFEVSVQGYTVEAEAFEVKSIEFLFMLGGGVEFPGPNFTMFIEARGSGGLTPMYSDLDIGGGITRKIDIKSETAELVVGVCF